MHRIKALLRGREKTALALRSKARSGTSLF